MRIPILIFALLLLLGSGSAALAICEEHASDSKRWTLQARESAAARKEREKAYRRMTTEERASISDLEHYPANEMYCGKGFSGGLGKVTINGKVGFIDKSGRLVIKPSYLDASRFSEGLAAVEFDNGNWGFIDTKGNVAIKPRFDWALTFKEGRAMVQVGEKWGFIDSTGSLVVGPNFDGANSFSEGLARVQLYLLGELVPGDKEQTMRYKTGYIDRDGRWVIEPKWDGGSSFNGGMARVSRNVGYSNGVVSEDRYIDKTGKELFEPDSWYITSFSEDALVVAVGADREYSFIGRDGKRLTKETFDYLDPLSEGLAVARTDGRYGYVNRTGEYVIPPSFEWAMGFSNGLACARKDQNKWGYIDTSGKFVIQPAFQWCWRFNDGAALVAEGHKTGYIDRNGKYIWKPSN
jgi:hypothetical protein